MTQYRVVKVDHVVDDPELAGFRTEESVLETLPDYASAMLFVAAISKVSAGVLTPPRRAFPSDPLTWRQVDPATGGTLFKLYIQEEES